MYTMTMTAKEIRQEIERINKSIKKASKRKDHDTISDLKEELFCLKGELSMSENLTL